MLAGKTYLQTPHQHSPHTRHPYNPMSNLDVDSIDLRSLAAQGKLEHLTYAINEQRARYHQLILKALAERDEERRNIATTTKKNDQTNNKNKPLYDSDSDGSDEEDPDMLTLNLLSSWVDATPEIDEETLAMELSPNGTIGDDAAIRKRKRKELRKRERQLQQSLRHDDDIGPSLDEQVPIGVGMTPLLLSTVSDHVLSYDCMCILLQSGADPEARQPLTLASPLHLACLKSVRGSQAPRNGGDGTAEGGPVTATSATAASASLQHTTDDLSV